MMKFNFRFVDFSNMANGVTWCGCKFCKGKNMRKDVMHFKVFVDNLSSHEFYLHLDKKTGKGDFIEK